MQVCSHLYCESNPSARAPVVQHVRNDVSWGAAGYLLIVDGHTADVGVSNGGEHIRLQETATLVRTVIS